jgi:hypothetical protein
MNKLEKFLILGLQVGLIASPLAFAQQTPPPPPVQSFNDVLRIINVAINWLFTLLIILAVVYFILAAFEYLTSGGDKEKTDKAKNKLIYGIVAIVVAILARGIPALVGSFFNVRINVPQ